MLRREVKDEQNGEVVGMVVKSDGMREGEEFLEMGGDDDEKEEEAVEEAVAETESDEKKAEALGKDGARFREGGWWREVRGFVRV